jgi:hypothetical protein
MPDDTAGTSMSPRRCFLATSKSFALTRLSEWGVACFYAYLAYNDARMLEAAQNAWNSVSAYQIDQSQANAGTHQNRNVTFSSQCQGRQCFLLYYIVV